MPATLTTASDRVTELLARPYARLVQREGADLFTASLLEFPGVAAEGHTADEALSSLNEALAMVLELMIEEGDQVPEPFAAIPYSGRLNLRIPPRLHADAARAAAIENVSLNRFLSDAVARRVGAVMERDRQDMLELVKTVHSKPPEERPTLDQMREVFEMDHSKAEAERRLAQYEMGLAVMDSLKQR